MTKEEALTKASETQKELDKINIMACSEKDFQRAKKLATELKKLLETISSIKTIKESILENVHQKRAKSNI